MRGLTTRVRRAVDASVIGTLLESRRESSIVAGSAHVGSRLSHIVRHSFLFRWLTTEPDPEVIVIDLRETWTVGPIISLLDWIIAGIRPYWEGSALKGGLDGLVTLGERAAETRAGQLAARLLMPPEPPSEDEEP